MLSQNRKFQNPARAGRHMGLDLPMMKKEKKEKKEAEKHHRTQKPKPFNGNTIQQNFGPKNAKNTKTEK